MSELDERHDAAAAYALDALDPVEREEFEGHLAGCARCRREVAELGDAAAELALLSDAPPPPPSLRAAVLAGITDVEQLAPLPGRPRRALVVAGTDEPEPEAAPSAAPADPMVDELALRRANRRTRVLTLLVAAVTVVALALGGVVWTLARPGQTPVAGQQLPQVDPSLLSAPDAKIYATRLSSGEQVSFVVSKQRNQAAFVGANLPSPGVGNVYHLWRLQGNLAQPDTTLTGGADSTQTFDGPIDTSTGLAINVEPAGTTPQVPSSDPIGIVSI